MITFQSKYNHGGYGDRIIGLNATYILARHLNMKFNVSWEVHPPPHDESINLGCLLSCPLVDSTNLRELWKDKHIVIQSNTPIHRGLYTNPFFPDLKNASCQLNTIRAFREIVKYLPPSDRPLEDFEYGIQIRCGDTFCMPHSHAEEYIPPTSFFEFSRTIHKYLTDQGVIGKVFVTSDTHLIYPFFDNVGNDKIQYVYIHRNDDIHYDFHNSNNRRHEIIHEHQQLQRCKHIIVSGLRSNFGVTAAYCSPVCETITVYPSFKTFRTSETFVSKVFGI